jgi:hypothetical protein
LQFYSRKNDAGPETVELEPSFLDGRDGSRAAPQKASTELTADFCFQCALFSELICKKKQGTGT